MMSPHALITPMAGQGTGQGGAPLPWLGPAPAMLDQGTTAGTGAGGLMRNDNTEGSWPSVSGALHAGPGAGLGPE